MQPHPPASIPLFAIGPYIAAAISAAVAALILGPTEKGAGRVLTLVAIALALVSFGPHTIVDPAFPMIWPGVLTAWAAIATFDFRLAGSFRTATACPEIN